MTKFVSSFVENFSERKFRNSLAETLRCVEKSGQTFPFELSPREKLPKLTYLHYSPCNPSKFTTFPHVFYQELHKLSLSKYLLKWVNSPDEESYYQILIITNSFHRLS